VPHSAGPNTHEPVKSAAWGPQTNNSAHCTLLHPLSYTPTAAAASNTTCGLQLHLPTVLSAST
jgi:hypothetical protein